MKKNTIFYIITSALLLTSFLFFNKTNKELIRLSDLTNKATIVYSGFQNLSKQINNAAVINPDLLEKAKGSGGVSLFYTDSETVMTQLGLLRSNVLDSVNVRIAGQLTGKIRSELSWILKSNVPDSILKHKAPKHITELHRIDSLIKLGIERTNYLFAYRQKELNESLDNLKVWLVLFITLSGILIIFITINLFWQRSKRKGKEEELETKELHFRNTLDNLIEGVQIHDPSWRYVYVNDTLAKYSKSSKEDLLGYTLMEKYPGIEHSDLFKVFERCMIKRVSEQMETEFIFPDGTKADFELSIQPVPEGIFILSVDITERRRAEKNLKQNIKELSDYKFALDESTIIAITDQKGIIKHVNENFCKISKYTETELLGQDHRIINSGFHSKEFIRILWLTIANGKIWKGELKNKAKDGTYYWVDTTIVPFLNEAGKPYQYLAIRSDITERKEAEENLQKSVKELSDYKFALDESTIIAITDQKGIIKHVNENFCKISKYSEAELLGQDHRIINSGFHSKEFIRILWLTIANGKIWKGELKNKAKDGTYYWVDTTIVPFLNEGGNPYQYLAIRSDITERKKNEEKISTSEAKYRKVAENIHESLIIEDLDGKLIYANNEFNKMFGYDTDELKELTLKDYTAAISYPEVIERHQNRIKGLSVAEEFVYKGKKKDGTEIWVEARVSSILEKGKIVGTQSLERDITERKLAEEKIVKANRLYAFISAINQSIVHIKDEEELLIKACDIATGIGGFKMAWIGLLDEKGALNMVRIAGEAAAIEEMRNFSGLDFTAAGLRDTPTGKVFSTGKYAVSNNIQDDPIMKPWKDRYIKHGIAANISLPIKKFGKIIGVFGFNSSIENYFDSEEIKLLEEAAGDISFALENFEKEKLRVQAEIQLEENEAKLKKAQSIAHIGHWDLDFATGIAIWSEEACRIYGIDVNDNKQSFEFWASFLHPDDKDRVVTMTKEQQRSMTSISFEHRIIRRDGTIRHIQSESKFEFDEKGKPTGLYGVTHDITAQKISEENIRQSEERYRQIVETSQEGIWLIDADNKTFFVNKKFSEMFGYSFEEMMGKTNFDLMDEEGKKIAKEKIERRKSGISEAFELVYIAKNGKRIWTNVSATPIISDTGNYIGGLAMLSDITGKKIAEQQREFDRNNLNALINNTNDLSWSVGTDFKLITFNTPFYEIIKFATGIELKTGDDVFSVALSPEQLESFKTLYNRAFTGEIFTEIQYVESPVESWIEVSFFPIKNGNEVIGTACHSRDITERKKSEQEREKMISDIIQRNKNFEQFAYIVSHNLRGPVANILGISNVLKGKLSEEDRVKAKAYLIKAVGHLDEVVKDMMKILQTRTEITENNERVYLPELVDDIKLSIQNLIQKEKAEILTDFSEVDEIKTLKSYIHSIFYNLILNSLKYRRPDKVPLVSIKSEIHHGRIRLTFTDNGRGMDLELYGDKVFGLYQRFHFEVQGKGLGLFMVKTQVEVLGGNISVKSKPDWGTEFLIELPA